MVVQGHRTMNSLPGSLWLGIYQFCVLMRNNFVASFVVTNCNWSRTGVVDTWTPAWHIQAEVPTLKGSTIDFFIIEGIQSFIRATLLEIHFFTNFYVIEEVEVKYICYNTHLVRICQIYL